MKKLICAAVLALSMLACPQMSKAQDESLGDRVFQTNGVLNPNGYGVCWVLWTTIDVATLPDGSQMPATIPVLACAN